MLEEYRRELAKLEESEHRDVKVGAVPCPFLSIIYFRRNYTNIELNTSIKPLQLLEFEFNIAARVQNAVSMSCPSGQRMQQQIMQHEWSTFVILLVSCMKTASHGMHNCTLRASTLCDH